MVYCFIIIKLKFDRISNRIKDKVLIILVNLHISTIVTIDITIFLVFATLSTARRKRATSDKSSQYTYVETIYVEKKSNVRRINARAAE